MLNKCHIIFLSYITLSLNVFISWLTVLLAEHFHRFLVTFLLTLSIIFSCYSTSRHFNIRLGNIDHRSSQFLSPPFSFNLLQCSNRQSESNSWLSCDFFGHLSSSVSDSPWLMRDFVLSFLPSSLNWLLFSTSNDVSFVSASSFHSCRLFSRRLAIIST